MSNQKQKVYVLTVTNQKTKNLKSPFHESLREIHVEDFFTFQVFRFSRLGVLASLAISVFACVYIVV